MPLPCTTRKRTAPGQKRAIDELLHRSRRFVHGLADDVDLGRHAVVFAGE